MAQTTRRAMNICINPNSKDEWSATEILQWCNDTLNSQISNIEHLATGAAYCCLMDVLFPNVMNLKKVKLSTNQEYEFIQNFRQLQQGFKNLRIATSIPIVKLVQADYDNNLDFAKWFRSFYEANFREMREGYDPLKARGGLDIVMGRMPLKRLRSLSPEKAREKVVPKLRFIRSRTDISFKPEMDEAGIKKKRPPVSQFRKTLRSEAKPKKPDQAKNPSGKAPQPLKTSDEPQSSQVPPTPKKAKAVPRLSRHATKVQAVVDEDTTPKDVNDCSIQSLQSDDSDRTMSFRFSSLNSISSTESNATLTPINGLSVRLRKAYSQTLQNRLSQRLKLLGLVNVDAYPKINGKTLYKSMYAKLKVLPNQAPQAKPRAPSMGTTAKSAKGKARPKVLRKQKKVQSEVQEKLESEAQELFKVPICPNTVQTSADYVELRPNLVPNQPEPCSSTASLVSNDGTTFDFPDSDSDSISSLSEIDYEEMQLILAERNATELIIFDDDDHYVATVETQCMEEEIEVEVLRVKINDLKKKLLNLEKACLKEPLLSVDKIIQILYEKEEE